jgi:hypothetical protein
VPISDSSSFRTSHALMHRSWQVKKMGVLGGFTSKNIWIFHGDLNQKNLGKKRTQKWENLNFNWDMLRGNLPETMVFTSK